jgi:hypothetical protein
MLTPDPALLNRYRSNRIRNLILFITKFVVPDANPTVYIRPTGQLKQILTMRNGTAGRRMKIFLGNK